MPPTTPIAPIVSASKQCSKHCGASTPVVVPTTPIATPTTKQCSKGCGAKPAVVPQPTHPAPPAVVLAPPVYTGPVSQRCTPSKLLAYTPTADARQSEVAKAPVALASIVPDVSVVPLVPVAPVVPASVSSKATSSASSAVSSAVSSAKASALSGKQNYWLARIEVFPNVQSAVSSAVSSVSNASASETPVKSALPAVYAGAASIASPSDCFGMMFAVVFAMLL